MFLISSQIFLAEGTRKFLSESFCLVLRKYFSVSFEGFALLQHFSILVQSTNYIIFLCLTVTLSKSAITCCLESS